MDVQVLLGAGLAIVISRSGIPTAIVIQAVVILAVCLLVVVARERAGERLLPWSRGAAQEHVEHQQFGFHLTMRNLRLAMSTRTTFTLIYVALTAFLCEGLYDPLTTEFFIQKLGWGAETYATNQGTLGVTGEPIGELSGGFLASRYGGKPMALVGLVLVMATLLTFSFLATAWDNPIYSHVMLLPTFRGSIAFTTVSLLSLYMKSCWTAAAAT